MWILTIFTVFLVSPLQAHSLNQCPQKTEYKAIDFQNEFGPQRLQGQVGWCFAYAGADLLTHYLYQQGEISGFSDSEIVSASAMALMNIATEDLDRIKGALSGLTISNDLRVQAKELEIERSKISNYLRFLKIESRSASGEKAERLTQEIREQERAFAIVKQKLYSAENEANRIDRRFHIEYSSAIEQGGWAAYSGQAMAKSGICTESKVRSSYMDTWDLLPLNLVDQRGRVDKLKILSHLVRYQREEDIKAFQVMFPGASEETIAQAIRNSSPVDLPFEILSKSCEGKPVKNIPEIKKFFIEDEKKPKASEIKNMFATIDAQVEQKNAVVFSTDGDIFDRAGIPFTFDVGHSVLVVGKRFNCKINEPEYIIRNSWGPNACQSYLPYFIRETVVAKQASAKIQESAQTCQVACIEGDQDEADPVRNCLDDCREVANRALIKVNRPPYYCENGNYVVRKSHLQKGSRAIYYFVPSK